MAVVALVCQGDIDRNAMYKRGYHRHEFPSRIHLKMPAMPYSRNDIQAHFVPYIVRLIAVGDPGME